MSIAEKLTVITENEQKVYDSGYNKGVTELDDLVQGKTTAFYNDRITKIVDYQFYGYGGNGGGTLRSINCPNVTSVGYCGFSSNYMLGDIYLPKLQTASGQAFAYNSYRHTLNFPELTTIDSRAFYNNASLATVIIGTTNCVLANADAFGGTKIASGTGYIYVPDEAVDTYKTATNWVTYANQIKGISELGG